jgi:hypothetical protein
MPEEPTNHNEAGEVAPSTVEKQAPSVAEENSPSTDEAVATDIPTANAPDPDTNLVENPEAAREKGTPVVSGIDESALNPKTEGRPADRKTAPPKGEKRASAKAAGDKPAAKAGDKPAASAKKEKAPAVEDKPFAEFIQQDYLPALKKALAGQGVPEIDLTFKKQKVPIAGYTQDEYWQIIGHWQNGLRQFNLYFPDEDIQGKRAFSCNEGSKPSTLEPFLIDERKVTLDLMIYGVMQRLNGQKWLALN